MTNLEYLENIKKEDKTIKEIIDLCDGNIKIDNFGYTYRQVKALEIIAEELCILNNPKYEVTALKPKIQLNKYVEPELYDGD